MSKAFRICGGCETGLLVEWVRLVGLVEDVKIVESVMKDAYLGLLL